MKEAYKSKVYTDRPPYADFAAPQKFEAIKSIIAKRLIEHPNAICSYSGGSDSDIMLHLIEHARKTFNLPPVHYCFFNTGLEMKAIKDHVKDMEKLYGVEIKEYRPKKNIVLATREYGVPFISKIVSSGLEGIQKKKYRCQLPRSMRTRKIKSQKGRNLGSASQNAKQQSIFCAAATPKVSRARIYSW
mgnify:CR=1 FL=1